MQRPRDDAIGVVRIDLMVEDVETRFIGERVVDDACLSECEMAEIDRAGGSSLALLTADTAVCVDHECRVTFSPRCCGRIASVSAREKSRANRPLALDEISPRLFPHAVPRR